MQYPCSTSSSEEVPQEFFLPILLETQALDWNLPSCCKKQCSCLLPPKKELTEGRMKKIIADLEEIVQKKRRKVEDAQGCKGRKENY
jgi:hypothetical protein